MTYLVPTWTEFALYYQIRSDSTVAAGAHKCVKITFKTK